MRVLTLAVLVVLGLIYGPFAALAAWVGWVGVGRLLDRDQDDDKSGR